jgi:hypothetical protein
MLKLRLRLNIEVRRFNLRWRHGDAGSREARTGSRPAAELSTSGLRVDRFDRR